MLASVDVLMGANSSGKVGGLRWQPHHLHRVNGLIPYLPEILDSEKLTT